MRILSPDHPSEKCVPILLTFSQNFTFYIIRINQDVKLLYSPGPAFLPFFVTFFNKEISIIAGIRKFCYDSDYLKPFFFSKLIFNILVSDIECFVALERKMNFNCTHKMETYTVREYYEK